MRFQRSVPAAVRPPAVLIPANPCQAPDNPSTTPRNPMPTPADPSQTPANPSQAPSSPHQAPSDPRRRKRAIPAESHSQSTEASLSHATTDIATAAKQPTGGFADAGTAPAQREIETSGHQVSQNCGCVCTVSDLFSQEPPYKAHRTPNRAVFNHDKHEPLTFLCSMQFIFITLWHLRHIDVNFCSMISRARICIWNGWDLF